MKQERRKQIRTLRHGSVELRQCGDLLAPSTLSSQSDRSRPVLSIDARDPRKISPVGRNDKSFFPPLREQSELRLRLCRSGFLRKFFPLATQIAEAQIVALDSSPIKTKRGNDNSDQGHFS
jgi:hypothetical protein